MSISNETKFTFDVQGYLHLRQAMTPGQVAEYTSWATELEHTDLSALNRENPGWDQEQMNHPVSRIFDADPRFCGFLDSCGLALCARWAHDAKTVLSTAQRSHKALQPFPKSDPFRPRAIAVSHPSDKQLQHQNAT